MSLRLCPSAAIAHCASGAPSEPQRSAVDDRAGCASVSIGPPLVDRHIPKLLGRNNALHEAHRGAVGCGTGRLLISLARETGADIEGVDIDPTKVALARRLAPFGRYHCAAIDDWARSCQGSYDLALISLERFEESRNSFALSVALNKLAERVIVYSYSNRDLLTCATRAGVRLERVDGNAGQLVRSTARSLPVIQRSDG